MKIHSIKCKGIGVLDDFCLSDNQLGSAKLIAMTGANGAGKTSAMELIPGIIYRDAPSRGPIVEMASQKTSFIELDVEMQKRVVLRLMLDNTLKSPKSEGVITEVGHAEPLAANKLREYDEQVAKLFPPKDLFYATSFAIQGGAGRFLDMERAERREMVIKLLGLSGLQKISDSAGKQVAATEQKIAELRGRIEGLRAQAATPVCDMLMANKAAVDAVTARCAAEEAEQSARTAHDAAKASLIVAEQAMLAAEQDHRRQAEAHRQSEAAVGALEAHIAKLQSRVAGRAGLELLAMDLPTIQASIDALEAQVTKDMDAERNESRADQGWQVKLAELEKAGTTLKHSVEILEQWVARAEKARANVADVPCGAGEAFSACKFLRDTVEMRQEYPGKLEELETARASLAGARAEYASHKQARPVKAVRTSCNEKLVNARRARNAAHDAEKALAGMAEVEKELTARCAELELAKATLSGTTVTDARPDAQKRHGEAAGDELTARRALLEASAGLNSARIQERDAHTAVARLEESAKSAEKAAAGVKEAEAQLIEAIANQDDWKSLQTAFGKTGIQALELDASCPSINALANRLLQGCYGSRFAVSLETQRLTADGKKYSEDFDLKVIDNKRGTDGPARKLSGGEKVVIGEAIALAVSIFNCEKSEMELRTLWRDEASGALDPESAVKYIELLRRAIDLGRFDRCFFVSHSTELQALADMRLRFEDGRMTVE